MYHILLTITFVWNVKLTSEMKKTYDKSLLINLVEMVPIDIFFFNYQWQLS